MLNDSQNSAFEDVKKVLSEHFENYVLIIETECEDPETKETATFWRGSYQGHSCAVGLCEKYKQDLLTLQEKQT